VHLVGPKDGLPTPADILDLYTKLTGNVPTPAERAEIQSRYNARLQADQT
jgi:hypothetical protein